MPSSPRCGKEALEGESFRWPEEERVSPAFAALFFRLESEKMVAGLMITGYLFRQAGWMTVLIMLSVGAAAGYTAKLIPRCLERAADLVPEGERCGEPLDWPIIGRAAMGRPGALLVGASRWGELLGCVVSLLVLQGGILGTLLPLSRAELTAAAGALMALTSLLAWGVLDRLPLMGLAGIVLVDGSLFASALELPEMPDGSQRKLGDLQALPEVISLVLFLSEVHAQLPSVFMPMQKKHRWPEAVELTFAACAVLYASTGSLIYAFYGDRARESLTEYVGRDMELEPLPGVAGLQQLVPLFFAAKLQATLPGLTRPLIAACETPAGYSDLTGTLLKVLVRVIFAAACTGVAVVLQEIGSLTLPMALTGCLFSTSAVLILPTAFYLKLTRFQLHWTRILWCGLLFLAGFAVMFSGVWSASTRAIALVYGRDL